MKESYKREKALSCLAVLLLTCIVLIGIFGFISTYNIAQAEETYSWEIKHYFKDTNESTLNNITDLENKIESIQDAVTGTTYYYLSIDVHFYAPASLGTVDAKRYIKAFQMLINYSSLYDYILNDSPTIYDSDYNEIPISNGLRCINSDNKWADIALGSIDFGVNGVKNIVGTAPTSGSGVLFNTTLSKTLAYNICFYFKTDVNGDPILPENPVSLEATFDFPEGASWPGYGATDIIDKNGDSIYKNANGTISGYGKFTSTPLQIGDAAAEPSAELDNISLTDSNGNEYLSTDASGNLTVGEIPYATANDTDGLTLSFDKISHSATVSVSSDNGAGIVTNSDGTIKITGLDNGEVVTISVSDDSGSVTKTYTFTADVAAPASDATLKSLTCDKGTLTYDSNSKTYSLEVKYAVNELTLYAEATDNKATVSIDGTVAATEKYKGSKKFTNLSVGDTTKDIVVTAEDGTSTTYYFKVTRSAAYSDVTLKEISFGTGKTATYNSSTKTYTYELPEGTTGTSSSYSFIVLGQSDDKNEQALTLDGVNINSNSTSTPGSLAEKGDKKTYTIKVTAQSTASETYTLIVSRAKSSDAGLKQIEVKEGTDSKSLYDGSKWTYIYNIRDTASTSLTLKVESIDKNATVEVYLGTDASPLSDSNSASNIAEVTIDVSSMSVGSSITYKIKITPQNGLADNTKEHTGFSLYKANDDCSISSLELKDDSSPFGTFSPESYDGTNYIYIYKLPYQYLNASSELGTVTKFTVGINLDSAKKNSVTDAVASGVGAGNFSKTSDVLYTFTVNAATKYDIQFEFTVASEIGTTRKYTVKIVREAANTDNSCSITLGGNVYNNGDVPLNNLVARDMESINVSVSPTNSFATVRIKYKNSDSSTYTENISKSAQITLSPGVKVEIVVVVIPQSGDSNKKEYTFYVMPQAEGKDINSISLSTTATAFTFDSFVWSKSTTEYTLTVPYRVTSAAVAATASDYATISGNTTYSLEVNVQKIIKVYATSESGVKGTEYTIKITRQAANEDFTLSNVKVTDTGGSTDYLTFATISADKTVARLDRSITNVKISADANTVMGSSITAGTGAKTLNAGKSNSIIITVTAESGKTKNYTLVLIPADDINTISGAADDKGSFTFAAATYAYNYAVNYEIDKLTLTLTLANNNAVVYFKDNAASEQVNTDGTASRAYTLNLNNIGTTKTNNYSFYAVSEYAYLAQKEGEAENKGSTYTFTITRNGASTDATLSSLYVTNSSGTKIIDVSSNVQSTYHQRVDNGESALGTIAYVKNDINATATINKTDYSLASGKNSFIITVTAQDGKTTKTYTIEIVRADDINTISNFVDKAGKLSFSFTSNVCELAVPYATDKINLKLTLGNKFERLYFNGVEQGFVENIDREISLSLTNTGSTVNTFKFYAVSQYDYLMSNSEKGQEYTIKITREEASGDATLKSLSATQNASVNLITGFSSSLTAYELRVDSNTYPIKIVAAANDANATVSFSPSDTITLSLNSHTKAYITVTAEDKTSTKQYIIDIYCASDKADITGVTVDGNSISFDASNTATLSDAPFSTTALEVAVTTNDSSAIVTGEGSWTLRTGDNTLEIYAISQYGKLKGQTKADVTVYTIKIKRNVASSDATLKSLSIKANGSAEMLSGFSSGQTIYNLKTTRATVNVLITPVLNDPNASMTGAIGNIALTPGGTKECNIYITAENGTTKSTYTINIVAKGDNAKINSVKSAFDSGAYSQITFDAQNIKDFGNVAYDCLKIKFDVDLDDGEHSTLYINRSIQADPDNCEFTLTDGENTFTIYASAEDGTKGTEYTVKVSRTAADTNCDLKTLSFYSDSGYSQLLALDQTFNKGTIVYSITLGASVAIPSSVYISAEADSANASVSGDGMQSVISNGSTVSQSFTITVTAQSGATKSYSVTLVKNASLSSDASIKSISLADSNGNVISWIFDAAVEEQTDVTIPFNIAGVVMTITPNDSSAIIVGNGFFAVSEGQTKKLIFQVTAQDGTKGKLYSFNVTRESASHVNTLNDLSLYYDGAEHPANLGTGLTSFNWTVPRSFYNSVILKANVKPADKSTISDTEGVFTNVTSYSRALTLTGGDTKTIILNVKAQNGDIKTYSAVIKCANSDTSFTNVTITGRNLNLNILESDFTAAAKTYSVNPSIDFYINVLNIMAHPTDIYAKVTGTNIGTVSFNDGDTSLIVKFRIVADDGTLGNEYTITVPRKDASDDAELKSLKVQNATGSSSDILLDVHSSVAVSYSLKNTRAIASVNISAVANHAGATVTGDVGTVALTAGNENILKIYVTAEDGTKKTYTVKITLKDDDATIGKIQSAFKVKDAVFGALSDLTFTADGSNFVYSFAAPVAYNTEKIKFAVTLNNSYAKLYVDGDVQSDALNCEIELKDGANSIVIYAVAEDGTKGAEYTVNVERTAADTDTSLSALEVKDSETATSAYSFSEGAFNPSTKAYTVVLAQNSKISSVFIKATANKTTSVVSGDGIHNLTETAGIIHNTFKVTVTAQSGDTAEYTVTVIRSDNTEASDDNSVSDITIKGNNKGTDETYFDFAKFNKNVPLQQAFTVPYGVSTVYLAVSAHEKATISGVGAYSIKPGETITINFQVTAEDGTAGTAFSVDVTREAADTDNVLTSLFYVVDVTTTALDLTKGNVFNINIPNNITEVTVGGVAPAKATVSGFGTITLSSSLYTHTVAVIAENGDVNAYTLIFNKKSDDSTIKSILIDGVEHFGDFTATNGNTYEITVPYSQKNIEIKATANYSAATVSGNGTFVLTVGENTFEVYATSEAGTKGTVYTIKVTQEAPSSDATLESLTVRNNADNSIKMEKTASGGAIVPFSNELDLTSFPEINEIMIEAVSADSKATIEGLGVKTLKTAQGKSTEIFTVKVTAEDGNTVLIYEIKVIRDVLPENDTTINAMSLIGSDTVLYLGTASGAKTAFTLSQEQYNLIVPYATHNVTLSVSNNNGAVATIKIDGALTSNTNFVLNNSRATVITFFLTSASGNFKSSTYTVTITKETPSSDATLKDLTIDGYTISGFNPSKTSYDITMPYLDAADAVKDILVDAAANSTFAAVSGTGSVSLQAGSNAVNITVTAEDGTTNTYTVNIKRLCSDNTLENLEIENLPFENGVTFDKDTRVYTLKVGYGIDMINIIAEANSDKATVVGAGLKKNLNPGENNVFTVYAVSETGVNGTMYTVTVYREAVSSDATLSSLTLKTYNPATGNYEAFSDLNPVFNKSIDVYYAFLDKTISSVEISAVPTALGLASVNGVGIKALRASVDGVNYNNVFDIVVTAQDGTTKTYTLYIYREDVDLDSNATVGDLQVSGSDGALYLGLANAKQKFDPSTLTYTITVPYTVESVTFNIKGVSATASPVTNETVSFAAANTITRKLKIVSQNGLNESSEYTVTVEREVADDANTLQYIKIDGVLVSGFDPAITDYVVTMPYVGDKDVNITAAANGLGTIVGGTGTKSLKAGDNTVSIPVRSQDGSVKTYTVLIKYYNDNALLSSLNIAYCNENTFDESKSMPYTFVFNPNTNTYTINVDKDVKSLKISGEATDQFGATIGGLGEYKLESDTKTITVYVLSADRQTTTTYTLNVVRSDIPSNESRLKSLKIGGHSLTFNPDVKLYTLAVGESVEDLNIDALAMDVNASVEITGGQGLDEGQNVILVTVTAEDGNTSVYQLIVKRAEKPDYLMMILLIIVFVLWMITITIFVIKSYKDNKNKDKKIQEMRIKD